jgi:hypothetical protein
MEQKPCGVHADDGTPCWHGIPFARLLAPPGPDGWLCREDRPVRVTGVPAAAYRRRAGDREAAP